MAKIGEQFVQDMVDRGRRELGGVLFQDSNVAQPMYPLRGGYEVSKENEHTDIEEGSILADRLKQADMSRDDQRDDRNHDRDRE
jgi:hypothetical protein